MDWGILYDLLKTVLLGVVLGLILTYLNLFILKREVRKMGRTVLRELARYAKDDGELKARVEEYARVAGRAFAKEVISSALKDLKVGALSVTEEGVEDVLKDFEKKLKL